MWFLLLVVAILGSASAATTAYMVACGMVPLIDGFVLFVAASAVSIGAAIDAYRQSHF